MAVNSTVNYDTKKIKYLNPFEEFLLCFGITFTVSVLSYEKNMPENIINIYLPAIFILFVLTWIWFSFANGYGKSILFPVLTVLFWFVAEIFSALSSILPEFIVSNMVFLFFADLFDMIIAYPALLVSGFLTVSMTVSRILICFICLFVYLNGFLLKKSGILPKLKVQLNSKFDSLFPKRIKRMRKTK